MLALEEVQTAFTAALELGPEHMPQGLFAGSAIRAMLGMAVHANTVSHARLVALEDTFPRTRSFFGQARFNELSRHYLGQPEASASTLAAIGRHFPAFLASHGEMEASDLAIFEWAWLTAYHAEDADALALTGLSGLDQAELLGVTLARHPASSLGRTGPALARHLGEEVPGLAGAVLILVSRPGAEVRVAAASEAMRSIFAALEEPRRFGNLFALVSEPGRKDHLSPDDFMLALIALLEAGALRRVD